MKEPIETMIMVIDDDENFGELLQFTLNASGFRTVRGRNGKEAVQMAKAIRPDIILMNLMMPIKNGWVAFREIRRSPKTRHIKVILFSATKDLNNRFKGADGYLQSPIDMEEMFETIGELLEDIPSL
jgi:CheY-like chemotaxis protein